MNLLNLVSKIDKELSIAENALVSSQNDQFWRGYKQGLEYAKTILIKKIEDRKDK